MESEVLSLLCDPDTRYDFELEGSTLRNTATGRVYPIRDGIPLFVSTLTGPNLRYQALYDRLAPGYDLAESFHRVVLRKPDFRREIIAALEIKPGMRVLEVGVGTGANLRLLPSEIEFYGLDISWGMLHKCRKKLKRAGRKAHLFQGEAGHLPFRAEVFDCVFHVGGINFFSEPERAIREMIWVAKPGTKIVIADETEKVVKNHYQKNPATKAAFPPGTENVRCPIDLVPEEMEEISAREVADGKLYLLSFRKPAKAK
ncbi:MAG TPA: methyltransferase domain-containing protein [Terracidiphilus sp.]|jgi:ubiquinone/menaquinone biosynthesis C-methylase UbiE|nr:methyltransferase domain-containing protein [Terracidiphilus sp.]